MIKIESFKVCQNNRSICEKKRISLPGCETKNLNQVEIQEKKKSHVELSEQK